MGDICRKHGSKDKRIHTFSWNTCRSDTEVLTVVIQQMDEQKGRKTLAVL
jgi:hypothetical protein